MISKSEIFQYSDPPFGRGRCIIKGIFFCSSSMTAMLYPSITSLSTSTKIALPLLICLVLSPNIRALSYFVRNGIVLCSSSIILPCLSRTILDNASNSQ